MGKPSTYAAAALDTSNFLADKTKFGWVVDVWSAIRQMSNILIVVFLFIGALATTLNYNLNTYGIKKVLPAVIQAAIIANFSFVLINAGVEAVGLLQKGLLGIGLGGASVSTNSWDTLAKPLKDILAGFAPTATTPKDQLFWGLIASVGVGVAMLLLWLVVGILYLRSFILAMLVAFAPLAILSMALPATQGLWKKYWEEFTKWLLLPIIVCFWLMIASLIAGIGALPPMLKAFVAMFAVFQAVRVPFSFKPAILGAAIGGAAGYVAGSARALGRSTGNLGKDLGARVVYGNNVTGGALRAIDRYRGRKVASLGVLKDSSTVIKGTSNPEPGENATSLERIRYQVRFLTSGGAAGRLINNRYEQLDMNQREGALMEGAAKFDAQTAAARSRGPFERQTRGQRAAALGLQQERAQSDQATQVQRDSVAAGEADPALLQKIAELNIQKDALSGVMESLRTGAKATTLATNEGLQAEKKLSDFRKKEAENLMKQVDADMNSNAVSEGSPLGVEIKRRLQNNPALRAAMQSYGVHMDEHGNGYVEGMMQNELNAVSATEAFESTVKNNQTNIAARDIARHGQISEIAKTHTTAGAIAGHMDEYLQDDQERVAAAEQIEKQLRASGLTSEQLDSLGVSSLVDQVRAASATPAGSAQRTAADAALARSIGYYNATDMTGVSDPDVQSRLGTAKTNRILANLRQKKLVGQSNRDGAQTQVETTAAASRLGTWKSNAQRIAGEAHVTLPVTFDEDLAATHALGQREGMVVRDLTGTAHHQIMNGLTQTVKSHRMEAMTGKGGDPSEAAITGLTEYLTSVIGGLDRSLDPTNPDRLTNAHQITAANTARTEAIRVRTDLMHAWADYDAAFAPGTTAKPEDQAAAKRALSKAISDDWLVKIS